MNEKTLEKIALITSLIGILIILIVSETLELKTVNISEINKEMVELDIKIEGQITNTIETDTITILNIKDSTGTIKAVIFEKTNLKISPGERVVIIGKVEEYKGELEIIVNTISSN